MLGALFPIHKQGEARVSSERKLSQNNVKLRDFFSLQISQTFSHFFKLILKKEAKTKRTFKSQKIQKFCEKLAKKMFSPFR